MKKEKKKKNLKYRFSNVNEIISTIWNDYIYISHLITSYSFTYKFNIISNNISFRVIL